MFKVIEVLLISIGFIFFIGLSSAVIAIKLLQIFLEREEDKNDLS